MADDERNRSIAKESLRHLDDAYNLARWLMRSDADAQDAVQEAYLRVLRFAPGFRGGNLRAWLLTIVCNVCYSQMNQRARSDDHLAFDEARDPRPDESADLEAASIRAADARLLRRALEALPLEFREAVVMRDMHELSYREIADASGVPIGTVMSRLARARGRLRQLLAPQSKEPKDGLQRIATTATRLR